MSELPLYDHEQPYEEDMCIFLGNFGPPDCQCGGENHDTGKESYYLYKDSHNCYIDRVTKETYFAKDTGKEERVFSFLFVSEIRDPTSIKSGSQKDLLHIEYYKQALEKAESYLIIM